uniref:Serine protease snake n=1 Tax=Lygus hesperus TaxID=30085 RepID=A0A0A9Z8F0_LYGHE
MATVTRFFIALLSLVDSCFGGSQLTDCVDTWRTLRCVIPTNCPTKLLVEGMRCPSGRTCCRIDRPNPYLPRRILPDLPLRGRSLLDEEVQTTAKTEEPAHLDEDRIIFPNEFAKRLQDTSSFRLRDDHFTFSDEERLFSMSLKRNELAEPVRKSVKYCREYTKLTIDVGYASPLLSKLVPMRYEMENCEPSVSPLVVGGSNTSISEFPHMAALGYNRTGDLEYLCGGTLISDQFVLTAAHCIQTKWGPPLVVHMGATKLHTKKAKMVSVKEMYIHPDYRAPACYSDIALVKLARTLKLTPKLRPACLPNEETTAHHTNKIAVATGWGRTGFGREASITLLKVPLKVMDKKKCSEYYAADVLTPSLPKGLNSDMICAIGNTDSFEDTCQGDSGGPLQGYLPDNRCMLQVVGITSFGKSCGAGVPGVYTKVASYLSWIEDIVWP